MSIKKTLCDPSVLFILGCFSVPLILARDTVRRYKTDSFAGFEACLPVTWAALHRETTDLTSPLTQR